MTPRELLEVAARDEISKLAPDLDEYVRELTLAEDDLEQGILEGYNDFLCYLKARPGMLEAIEASGSKPNHAAWPKQMPQRPAPRPPTLF